MSVWRITPTKCFNSESLLTSVATGYDYPLSAIMDFDHVIMVKSDGTVTDDTPNAPYAPELYNEGIGGTGYASWELMTGYTGQYGYHGPMMHASEYIGGRMARDILSTPGYYVSVYTPDGESWAVARIVFENMW